MKAYLLAAGYATRMYPLTRDRPKPLLEVAGQPILSHIVDRVVALDDLSEIVVIGNDRFHDAFASWADGLRLEVPLRVLNDGSSSVHDKLGAIGDLGFALREVPTGDEDWLVAAGDNLLAFDLRDLQRRYQKRGTAQLAVREVPPEQQEPRKYNEVTRDETGRVLRFREKPPDPSSPWVAIALYFLPATAAARLHMYLEQGGNPDAPGHFIEWLAARDEVFAERLPGGWFDIGSLAGLDHARAHFVPFEP